MTSKRVKTKKVKKQATVDVANIEVDPKKVLETKLVADMINLKDNEILGDLEVEDPEVVLYLIEKVG